MYSPQCAPSEGVEHEEDGWSSVGVRGAFPTLWHPQCSQLCYCQGNCIFSSKVGENQLHSLGCFWGYRLQFSIEKSHNRCSDPESYSRARPSGRRCTCFQLENRVDTDVWNWPPLIAGKCGCQSLPGIAQSESATVIDLEPHQPRWHLHLHMWAPLYLCTQW